MQQGIWEIAKANNIPWDTSVSKFLTDVEEHYDNKLGFDSKVNEKEMNLLY